METLIFCTQAGRTSYIGEGNLDSYVDELYFEYEGQGKMPDEAQESLTFDRDEDSYLISRYELGEIMVRSRSQPIMENFEHYQRTGEGVLEYPDEEKTVYSVIPDRIVDDSKEAEALKEVGLFNEMFK